MNIIKNRRIKLNSNVNIDDTELTLLRQDDGVLDYTIESGSLRVKYDLEKCSYQTIHTYLTRQGIINNKSGFARLINKLIFSMEANERDYTEIPSGWDYYVQSLYLSVSTATSKIKKTL